VPQWGDDLEPSMYPPLPDTRTMLATLYQWFGKLPVQSVAPLTGPTRETDALLHGRIQCQDDTLFLYGYTVGTLEHCFFYDTPWDESCRVPRAGHLEWYDGLSMPRAFRVRYSVSQPDWHEILDPLLQAMMKRTLRRLGTRPAVANPLTASAPQVLAQIDRWDERLRLLRRGRFLLPSSAPEAAQWLPTLARFGAVVGKDDASYLPYEFEVGATRYVFAVKLAQWDSRMTPRDHSPDASRAERRAHLAEVRRREQGLRLLAGARDVPVRFHPEDPGQHALELLPLQPGEPSPVLESGTTTYQLEPLAFPRP
jgi:hypothetical protein